MAIEQPPPPGWYPDPDQPQVQQRYWDGVAWTGQRAPLASADEPSGWIIAIGYLGSIVVIPGLMVAAYLHARRSVHARWILLMSLALLALWVVAGILGDDS